jgi:AcrR family transcriptional regulator
MSRPDSKPADAGAVPKSDHIADAARRLFGRYGFRRTSMDDIAREAGVAKATLYLHFAGKEDVFRFMLARTRSQTEQKCLAAEQLAAPFRDRLTALLDAKFGCGYEWFGNAEHWAELYATIAAVELEENQAFEQAYIGRLKKLLTAAAHAGEISFSGIELGPDTVAQTLFQAAMGAKMGGAATLDEYRARLRNLATLVTAALDKHPR